MEIISRRDSALKTSINIIVDEDYRFCKKSGVVSVNPNRCV
jgi:hypothetical protein